MARGLQSSSTVALLILLAATRAAWGQTNTEEEAARIEFFEKKVRPVLVNNCYNCHSADTNARGGLRVDDRNGLVRGGGRGPAVVPGDPEGSLLIRAIRQMGGPVKMPPKKKLTAEQIADLTQWIRDGAAWPQLQIPDSLTEPHPEYDELRAEHWAWQPLTEPTIPEVQDPAWARDPIDSFVLAGLEASNLQPVGDAGPLTLIRRLTFDLTGLPPRPEEVSKFLTAWKTAQSPQGAVAALVDRLLDTPAYGERWGRHWLDVARYAESTGSSRNVPYPHAWRYRDYVIDAFNNDKPYDEFIREQIAGDLLGDESRRDEHLIATGFLALGVRDVNQRFKVRFVMDNIDEQIDTISRSILALTVSCARCHDHKYEPIPRADYYALAGIFHSTDLCAAVRNKMGGSGMAYYDTDMLLRLGANRPTKNEIAAKLAATKSALAQAQAELKALDQTSGEDSPETNRGDKLAAAREQVKRMKEELLALNDPAAQGPVALGVRDAKTVGDTEIRIRGEAEKLGPIVPRGFLTAFEVSDARPINPDQSGRLELAHWLASRYNPLTPRVMVNRIWHHLFGRGLVSTVDNFGTTGADPTHPELLDHLATRFIDEGWSVKRLVKAIVLSRTYQLSAAAPADNLAVDPANRLLWRHNPRRLDAEEIRDAMLAASGDLDTSRPHGSPAMNYKVRELRNNGDEAKRLAALASTSRHRSIYLPLLRGLTPRALEVFDFAEQGLVTGSRDTTTVATQALYLLNDPFVRRQSQSLAERVLSTADDEPAGIELAYQAALGRPATPNEIERASSYLAGYAAAVREPGSPPGAARFAAWQSFCQAIFSTAEFRYLR